MYLIWAHLSFRWHWSSSSKNLIPRHQAGHQLQLWEAKIGNLLKPQNYETLWLWRIQLFSAARWRTSSLFRESPLKGAANLLEKRTSLWLFQVSKNIWLGTYCSKEYAQFYWLEIAIMCLEHMSCGTGNSLVPCHPWPATRTCSHPRTEPVQSATSPAWTEARHMKKKQNKK